MANINLSTEGSRSRQKTGSRNFGLTVMFLVLLLVCGAYGFLVYYDGVLSGNIEKTKQDYQKKYVELLSGNAVGAADFQNRMDIAESVIGDRENSPESMAAAESAMIPEAYLNSYSYDDAKKELTLECVAANYNLVAKQILSFKQSGYFAGVIAGETKFDPREAKIVFPVVLKLK